MEEVVITKKKTFFESLFGMEPTKEVRKMATEQEIVDGLTGCEKHQDYLSRHYRKCAHCQTDTLTRIREYGLSFYASTIDCGDILTSIYSCGTCGNLHTPYIQHRYDFDQD